MARRARVRGKPAKACNVIPPGYYGLRQYQTAGGQILAKKVGYKQQKTSFFYDRIGHATLGTRRILYCSKWGPAKGGKHVYHEYMSVEGGFPHQDVLDWFISQSIDDPEMVKAISALRRLGNEFGVFTTGVERHDGKPIRLRISNYEFSPKCDVCKAPLSVRDEKPEDPNRGWRGI